MLRASASGALSYKQSAVSDFVQVAQHKKVYTQLCTCRQFGGQTDMTIIVSHSACSSIIESLCFTSESKLLNQMHS